jgi:hypothetical protein
VRAAATRYFGVVPTRDHEDQPEGRKGAHNASATAIVGVRYDTAEVGHEMVEIFAYGTAVMIADAEPHPDHRRHAGHQVMPASRGNRIRALTKAQRRRHEMKPPTARARTWTDA